MYPSSPFDRVLKTLVVASALATMPVISAQAFTAYVSNEKDNTVSVIDTDKMEVIATWDVGQRPRGIIMSTDNKYVYLCASDDDTVQVLDRKTGKVVKELPSGPDPELFVFHPSGNPLYIANEDDNMVTIVDVEKDTVVTEVPVGVEPEGMGVSPDGKIFVNTSETTNMAHFISTETNESVADVLVDSRPRVGLYNHSGSQVWITAEIGGTIAVIDPNDGYKIVKKISFEIKGVKPEAIQPVGLRFLKDDSKALVALGPANRIAVIDTKSLEVEKYLLVGQRVWNLAITPDEKYALTTNGVSGDVSVIDLEKMKVIKSIKVGQFPWGVTVAPDLE